MIREHRRIGQGRRLAGIVLLAAAPFGRATVAAEDGQACGLDCDSDGVVNRCDACPGTVSGATVDRAGRPVRWPVDTDRGGVDDARDLCPGSVAGARVDRAGCGLDTDRGGVPDGADRCPGTPEDLTIDPSGCAADG